MTALRQLCDAEFEAAVAVPGAVLVHFVAAWCQPCARAEGEVAALAQLLRRRSGHSGAGFAGVPVMAADIDDAPHAAIAADVRGVPCLVLYRGGTRVDGLMGQWSAARLREWVDGLVKG